ncbi:HIT family protein [Streptosporangium sp. 'caverna']|uniref:HIT family protein n=1 Tax=Streptosporangium sp. 'caverna' TaxID=2202249 RepID=UPI000D7E012C|nr:HIT family protein [Streptosporangium sp. 'caverna']AWS43626.1 HIT family protein [Streptosporangium sp. 'caverna']
MTNRGCVFCAIVQGRQPAAIVFEDDLTLAFLDITAVMDGHTLVIPKRHATDLWQITPEDAAAVINTVHGMARRIREVLKPEGLTLFQANGEAGWQDVFHLHVHLVPRLAGDHLCRPWKAEPVALSELAATRARLS